ncbi:unnamed protein product [Adineta steineri]|uniref:Uncharacterized protein n=1 Tax=Adineta steineri TaxID=433720 RepID=A0A818FY25_9BILA|nr:unnamed protein product [Adineta steineri]
MEYKAKFISKSNDYTSIENQRLIHWFYQKFIQMNIAFPWSLIGQQLDEFNNLSFFVQYNLHIIFHTSSIHLQKLEKLFNPWFIIHLSTIIFVVIFLILFGFILYILLKKIHWSNVKLFQYTNMTFILSIIYWIGFVLWFTKLIILLPHVAGACSACNELESKQIYNSFLYGSKWFTSSFLSIMNNNSLNIDQLLKKCEQNLPLWSINDFIHLALLENQNYTKSEHYFGHCRILYELHENFIHLFCHSFVKKLLYYLITAIITTISHFVLYLITILLRRFIQNYQNQFDRLKSVIRPSTIHTTDHSMICPLNQNEYENLSTIVK